MDKDTLLNAIRKYLFYTLELNLYLDSFPNCSEAQKNFEIMSKKLNSLMNEYEEKYGQLQNFGLSCVSDSCSWTKDPWPWEQDKNRRCYR
ncbi:MAG: spore coat protein CotJB [Clostridium sp.]|uniref:spore coat protein CotJB n=1 Tax=Clostridium sp. DSM 8431 TaxID=1761781 RepID=UPI0008F38480|nr:spore coat protein CotJB [Clostridium sp. DSM 8431]MCR4943887.1 spore coat protein CotJB [Clostridium sp.]SFU46070.1 spore coat protein JB [Clostridium sp. DSM 8431]